MKKKDKFIHVKMDNLVAETYEDVLNRLNEINDKIEGALTSPVIKKLVITKECMPGQSQFVFDQDLTKFMVDVRKNTTWIHDEDYVKRENTITFKKAFKTSTPIDFVFYYIDNK